MLFIYVLKLMPGRIELANLCPPIIPSGDILEVKDADELSFFISNVLFNAPILWALF